MLSQSAGTSTKGFVGNRLAQSVSVVAICLLVSACGTTKTAQLAECKIDADQVFRGTNDSATSRHIQSCMEMHNYKIELYPSGPPKPLCTGDVAYVAYAAMDIKCYKSVSLVDQIMDH